MYDHAGALPQRLLVLWQGTKWDVFLYGDSGDIDKNSEIIGMDIERHRLFSTLCAEEN